MVYAGDAPVLRRVVILNRQTNAFPSIPFAAFRDCQLVYVATQLTEKQFGASHLLRRRNCRIPDRNILYVVFA